MRVQSINLNLIPTGVMPIVHLSQYDRDADGALLFNIFNGPAPFNLTGCTATINGTKPDGNVYTYPCTVHSNFLTSAVYDQMTTVRGTHEAEIRISDGDSVVGTLNFQMAIEKAGVSEIDVSHTDVPTLLENIQASVDEAEYWAEQAASAVTGVSSFNGRHGSVLPMAGDYDSEKILLASALHIGGETQNNVQEALEALVDDGGAGHTILNGLGQEMPQRKNLRFAGANVSDDAENNTTNVTISGGGSGGSTITVTTTETSLYGESVIISDGVSTFTGVFDSSGVCVIDGVTATGTLTITSGAATNQLNVPYYGNYTTFLSFWAATINVTTDPGINSAIVKKDGVQIGTVNFTSGSGTYIAGSTGAYTFEVTVGGVVFSSPTVTVTEQTTYSTTIDIFSATLNISTSASSLYGKTITIKKGSITVGTTTFSAQGSASYTVHETGTYTCECEGYSGSATVSAETTYNVTINAGLDLSAWISAGSTTEYPLNPSSYADFSALEADEAAVRQLMLVHNAVDYLAQATAGDTLMQSVINSDVCAKWINLSDYALDTLYANSDIADEMDTADKYGYGEWGITDSTTTPPTWGALGNVPIMTANNAPYGNVIYSTTTSSATQDAYIAFSGTGSEDNRWVPTSSLGAACYLGYTFNEPVCAKKVKVRFSSGVATTFKIQGSNDGFTSDINDIASDITQIADGAGETDIVLTNDNYYMSYRFYIITQTGTRSYGGQINLLQFYGRELKPLVPIMTADNAPKGTVTASSEYQTFTKWKAFDGNPSDGWFPQESDGYTNNYIQYTFSDSVKVAMAKFLWTSGSSASHTASAEIYGSTDGSVFSTIGTVSSAANSGGNYISVTPTIYKAVKGRITANSSSILAGNGYNFQFYGMDYSEKEFAQGSTRKTIYDHGVEVVAIESKTIGSGAVATKEANQLYTYVSTTASSLSVWLSEQNLPSGTYNYLCGKLGSKAQASAYIVLYDSIPSSFAYSSAYQELLNSSGYADSLTAMLDISQYTGTKYVGLYVGHSSASSTAQFAAIKELWIE